MIKTEEKMIIGLTEKVTIFGRGDNKKTVIARIDTGATKSSIDTHLAATLNVGPVVRTKVVKSAHGTTLRPVVQARIELNGRIIDTQFTIADRQRMKYRVLIGQNTLKHGFLIDPSMKISNYK